MSDSDMDESQVLGSQLPHRSALRWPTAELVLQDGTKFSGRSFGAPKSMAGEVVFSTGMVGYPEALTDPSYHGQILVLTYPLIGNYGVPSVETDEYGITKYFESHGGKICVAGLVIADYCEEPHHFERAQTLREWLVSQDIPAIMRVDTRDVVLHLRESGCAFGKIQVSGTPPVEFEDPNKRHLVREVSTKYPVVFGHGDVTVLCFDLGIKLNIIRCFMRHGAKLRVVPYDWDIRNEEFDGLFVSNGPGDPTNCVETIESCRWALANTKKPIFGICLGNQILALAGGGKTYKMRYGNRGQNQPVVCQKSKRVMITTQNHGFAVDMPSLDATQWEESFVNSNDGSNEGIRHKTHPFCCSVQFHPEAKCGPHDTEYLFEEFITAVRDAKVQEYINARPKKVLVLGAGPIQIAQAGEFDYSGSQCLKSLREEGIETVLINPNIATVQTAPGIADKVYFCPLDVANVERVIEMERPGGICLGWGGQTALNCGVELHNLGILDKYGVRVLGTPIKVIEVTEDRELFRDALLEIGQHVAESEACTTIEGAALAASRIGYPVMVRAAFCLGGLGSGIVNNDAELRAKVASALAMTPQVLVERCLAGWKEIEYEVVRDIFDNCVTVCNMENIDPMGIHTGESIVVAPSQTLSNDEFHMLRSAAVDIIRHLGVIGECNIQYALDPNSHRFYVIEVNARLSRSSALASKATGYPLAHVAAKLALGKALPDVVNAVTKTTSACFEPSLDYVVVKAPRWDMSKFDLVSPQIGSMMKSVGEVMSIGRTFYEAFQKALRMTDVAARGFTGGDAEWPNYEDEIRNPTPRRVFAIAKAFRNGYTAEQVHDMCKIDMFFLRKMQDISLLEMHITRNYFGKLDRLPNAVLREAKQLGFGDKQLALCLGCNQHDLRRHRIARGILPYVKMIDTVAGEFPGCANYLYLSYNASAHDVKFDERMVLVVGCGVYRIGNSVEFDYSGVMVTRELRKRGYKVMFLNYNPETVSTDFDECDRLYFDEVSEEVIIDITERERPIGVVLSVGGQLAQKLSLGLRMNQLPVWGTDPLMIDTAEDRAKFSTVCDEIGLGQPEWTVASNPAVVNAFATKVGLPVLVRPSYVLSGSAMSVVWREAQLNDVLARAAKVTSKHPVVVSKFYDNAMEYDVDIVALNGKILVHALCEHVENAGVHSGDATLMLPPQRTAPELQQRLIEAAAKLTARLDVTGPINIQFLVTGDGVIRVIEANVRASRSVPFVSKALGVSFPAIMTEAFLAKAGGYDLAPVPTRPVPTFVACKMSMFSFSRLPRADPIVGVEMASTGEVGVFAPNQHEAFLLALASTHFRLPAVGTGGILIAIDRPAEVSRFVPFVRALAQKFQIFTVAATNSVLAGSGIKAKVLHVPRDKSEPNVTTFLRERRISVVIQLRDRSKDCSRLAPAAAASGTAVTLQQHRATLGFPAAPLLPNASFSATPAMRAAVAPGAPPRPTDPSRIDIQTLPDDYHIRRLAVDHGVPLITDPRLAELFIDAFNTLSQSSRQQPQLPVLPYDHFVQDVVTTVERVQ